MAQSILLKRSSVAGNVPDSSDLSLGEIAINTADGAVYIKKGNNDIVAVHDNDILHIDTSNSRVGIGTTSPVYKLSVNSGTSDWPGYFKSTDNKAGIIIADDDTTAYFGAENSKAFMGLQAGIHANNLNIDGSGNVGIGTTSPDAQLEVENSGTGRIAISGTTGANLQFRPNTSYTAGGNFGIYTTGLTSGTYESTMTIKGYGSGVNDVMTIKGLGKVGIGTTTPLATLHVGSASGSLNSSAELFIPAGDALMRTLKIGHGSSTASITTDDSSKPITFTAGGSEKVRIDTSGRVGIKNTSPGSQFFNNLVVGNTSGDNGITIQSSATGRGALAFSDTDSATSGRYDGYINYSHNATYMSFHVNTGNEQMRINSNGNIGIGTTSPSVKFEVNGGSDAIAKITGTSTAARLDLATTTHHVFMQVIESDGRFRIYDQTAANEYLTISNAGNVGIGTSSPGKLLHLNQSGNSIPLLVQTDNHVGIAVKGGNSHDRYVSFQQTNGSVGAKVGWDHSSQTLKLNAVDTFGSSHLVVDTAGEVGIGTDSPSANLAIVDGGSLNNTDGNNRLMIDTSGHSYILLNSPDGYDQGIHFRNNTDGSLVGRIAYAHRSAGDSLSFRVAGSDRFVINSSGAVTFNSAYTFPTSDGSANQVLQTDGSGNLSFATVSGGGGSTNSITDADGDTKIQVEESSDEDLIRFDIAGTEKMVLSSTGLGISTPGAPTFGQLEVYQNGGTAAVTVHEDAGSGTARFHLREGTSDTYLQNRSGSGFEIRTEGNISTSNNPAVKIENNGTATFGYNTNHSAGVDVTGNITVTGTVDGRDIATDGSKLDGIEANATADQTASEILTAIKTVDGSGSGLDADTLDGTDSTSFRRRIFSTSITATPETRWIAFTKPFISGTGTSEYYHLDLVGYSDIGQTQSSLHYSAYIHVRSNGTTTNTFEVIIEERHKAGSEQFTFGKKQVASTSNIVYFILPEDYSAVEIYNLSDDVGAISTATNSMFSTTDTDPTGITTITPREPLHTNDNITVGSISSGNITSSGNIDVNSDAGQLQFGADNDMQIFHNGAGGEINNATGNFTIDSVGDILLDADGGDIKLQDAGVQFGRFGNFLGSLAITSGASDTAIIIADASGNVIMGGNVSIGDNKNLDIGNSDDLLLYHNGTNSFIKNATNDLYILNEADDKDIIFQADDGSGGVTNYIQIDGSEGRTLFNKHIRVNDNVQVQVGSSADLQIYHDSTDSLIRNYTGDLVIQNDANDKDIIFRSDDGSGGVTPYFKLDGANTYTSVSKNFLFQDNVRADFGNSSDLQIYHDGSNSYIKDAGTGNLNIQTNGVGVVISDTSASDLAVFNAGNGIVTLYKSGSPKLATKSDGVDITGELQADTLDIDGNADISGNLVLGGDLTVNGTTTTINAATLQVEDKNITLNYGSGDTSSSANDAGITIQDAVNSSTDAYFKWFQSGNKWLSSNPIRAFGGFELPDNNKLVAGDGNDLEIYHDGSNSIINDNGTGTIRIQSGGTNQWEFNGVNFKGNDGRKIILGDSSDLQIYHNGSDSYIQDTGTGVLAILSNETRIQNSAGTENCAKFTENGAVTLFYDNSAKLATKTDGVDITGELQSDSLDVDGNADISGNLVVGGKETTATFPLMVKSDTSHQGLHIEENSGAESWQMGVDVDGDLNFYNSGSTTPSITFDDSNNVGIGTPSPSKPLHVQFSGDHGIRIESEDSHASLYVDSHTGYGQYIRFTEENANKYWINSTGGNLVFRPAATGTAANQITFNASGAVGIGTATLTNKIHVNGNARIEGNLMAGGAAASNVPARPIHVKSAGDAAAIRIEDTTSSNQVFDIRSTQGNGLLFVDVTAGTTPMVISSTGFVRINHNTSGWDSLGTLTVRQKADGQGIGIIDSGSQNTLELLNDGSNAKIYYNVNNPILFSHLGGERMRIAGDGKVGVGTNNPQATFQVEEYGIDTTATSTTATTQIAIHSFAAATFRSARFTVQVTNSTDSTYHTTELLLVHDGTTANITEFGEIHTGSAVEATFDADISSGNVRLLATPATTDTMAFKVVCHSITT